MRDYLRGCIQDLIHRCCCLKDLIVRPLRFAELEGLAERCQLLLDDRIGKLSYLLGEIPAAKEGELRSVFRGMRACARVISWIEHFGIQALYYQTPEIGYLNKLAFRIHQEINLPLNPPSVACISTDYYFFFPFTNVIFVPVGEFDFLLHIPDLFHEIGHAVLVNRENETRLEKFNEIYSRILERITAFYLALHTERKRMTGPKLTAELIVQFHSQWKDYWIREFVCDLFALYTLGPAYAWSHFHLTAKKSEDVYDFPLILAREHPSADARMRILLIGMQRMGLESSVEEIRKKWESLPLVVHNAPDPLYQFAYPNELLDEVAGLVLQGLNHGPLSLFSPEKLRRMTQDSVIGLLNDAWKRFWQNPEAFRAWEERAIEKLRKLVSR